MVEATRALADEITTGLGEARTPGEQHVVKLLRERVLTHLLGMVGELREAGRYAFCGEPERVRAFASQYRRRKRQRARANSARASDPVSAPVENVDAAQ